MRVIEGRGACKGEGRGMITRYINQGRTLVMGSFAISFRDFLHLRHFLAYQFGRRSVHIVGIFIILLIDGTEEIKRCLNMMR